MSAPPGFNPDTSLLQQNASAPIVPFRGGGTPLSLDAFYQAILKGQPETIRMTLPESIADITNFAISVKNGKFVLEMTVKGKKKEAVATVATDATVTPVTPVATDTTVATDASASSASSGSSASSVPASASSASTPEETENADAIAALEVANEANRTKEEIEAVAASEAAAKAEAEEAKKREEEEILKKAREFLILEAARAFLRNVGNNISYEPQLSKGQLIATKKRIKESIKPPHERGKQSTLPLSSLSYANQVRAEANEMIAAAEAEKQLQLFEETQRVLKEALRVAGKQRQQQQQGHIKTTPRGSQGIRVEYSSVLPRGNGQTATSKTVKQATALQAKLETA